MAQFVDIDKFRDEAFYADTEADIANYVGKHGYADVAEVRHGHWKQNPYCKRIYYCSECGRHIEDGSNKPNPNIHFPYCHCGAKMDGKCKS